MLTHLAIRKMKPGPKRAQHSDGGGLVLEVLPFGEKVFRLR